MTHELEQFGDGTTAFASARMDAWHRLGTVVDHTMNAEEIMQTARLANWNVRKAVLTASDITNEGVTSVPVPNHFATVRTHPITGQPETLGVVGNDYEPFQNEAMTDLLNVIVDQSGAHFETAGSLRGGTQVFVTMKLPESMTIAGADDIDLYLAASNSHNGTSRFRIVATPVRVVCANTQRAAIQRARTEYSFKHACTPTVRAEEARAALGVMWNYFDEFQAAAERMINETLTINQFEETVNKIWPKPSDSTGRAGTNYTRRLAGLRSLYTDATTQNNIAGTRWAGYQAITEYLDHYAPAKSDTVRAQRALNSPTVAAAKEKAFALLSV